MKSCLWLGITVLGLAGCAVFSTEKPETGSVGPAIVVEASGPDFARESAEVATLLAYYQDMLGLPVENLKREYRAVSQAFSRDRNELGRLRLALLMCLPQVPWRDDGKILALLEGAASRKAAAESPLRHFVVMLEKLVQERQRDQKRADELQQKLDSMLEIERSLRERKIKSR